MKSNEVIVFMFVVIDTQYRPTGPIFNIWLYGSGYTQGSRVSKTNRLYARQPICRLYDEPSA